MATKPIVKLSGISKAFAGVQALQNVDVELYPGEVRGLAGENGGGKSTLIKVLSGFYTPDAGTIEINGKVYEHGLTPKQALREGIQVVYQDFSLFFNMTVADNITLPMEVLENKKMYSRKNAYKKAREVVKRLGMDLDMDALVGELPVADKQQVAIARAVLNDAKVLILDEPTTALTQKEVVNLLRVVKDLVKEGVSVVFVSHKMEEMLSSANTITVLRNGQKVKDGPIEEFDYAKLVYYMTGRRFEDMHFEVDPPAPETTPLMRVEDIGSNGLFENISFDLYAGEIIGIIGLLGSGRSELGCALGGLIPMHSGQVLIDGKPVKIGSILEALKHGIAYLPEDRLTEGLFMPQSIATNIVSPALERYERRGVIDMGLVGECADRWIKELSIATPSKDLAVEALSGGNQQKVVLSKWLATEPKILILNSPTAGIDVGSKYDIHRYIQGLARKGLGVLLISDDINEILGTCNRLLIMKRGHITATCDTKDMDRARLSAEISEVQADAV